MSTLSISPAFISGTASPRVAKRPTVRLTQRGRVVFLLAFLAFACARGACGGSDSIAPDSARDVLQLTTKQVGALDSTGNLYGRTPSFSFAAEMLPIESVKMSGLPCRSVVGCPVSKLRCGPTSHMLRRGSAALHRR